MSDERDETRSFSPFDDATWADDEVRPGRGGSGDRVRRSSGTPGESSPPQPAGVDEAGAGHAQSSAATDAARSEPEPEPADATRAQSPDREETTGGESPAAADAARSPSVAEAAGTRSAAAEDGTQTAQAATPAQGSTDADASRTRPGTADDPTEPQPRADAPTLVDGPLGHRSLEATSVMPAAADNPAWTGRAEVRAPQPGPTAYQSAIDWPSGPHPRPRDRWWMPIVVGIVVLLLLAALGWGIYLIVQNAGKNGNAPGPAVTTSAPPAPTTAATTQTVEPSSTPTTTTPTPTASTTEPTDDAVAIPALRGLTVGDAKSALHRVGIDSTRVIYRPSHAQPDTVIDSDPEEGREVPPDTTVTLVVAAPAVTTDAPATGD